MSFRTQIIYLISFIVIIMAGFTYAFNEADKAEKKTNTTEKVNCIKLGSEYQFVQIEDKLVINGKVSYHVPVYGCVKKS